MLRQIASGQSISVMIREAVAEIEMINSQSGSLKGTMKRLERNGFIWSKVLSMFLGGGGKAGTSLEIVGLTPTGYRLCEAAGFAIEQTEYERLVEAHEAERFPEHTLAILVFVREATRRQFFASELCPDRAKNFKADVLLLDVSDPDADWYDETFVEVERKGHTPAKWRHLAELNDGMVYVCALNPAKRRSLAREISGLGYGGWATDLRTLLYEKPAELWLEEIWPE